MFYFTKVLEVQSLSIRRAEEKSRKEIEKRREKVAEEMRSREVSLSCYWTRPI